MMTKEAKKLACIQLGEKVKFSDQSNKVGFFDSEEGNKDGTMTEPFDQIM